MHVWTAGAPPVTICCFQVFITSAASFCIAGLLPVFFNVFSTFAGAAPDVGLVAPPVLLLAAPPVLLLLFSRGLLLLLFSRCTSSCDICTVDSS